MKRFEEFQPDVRRESFAAPSSGLLSAALVGLMAFSAGCEEDEKGSVICEPTDDGPSTGFMDAGLTDAAMTPSQDTLPDGRVLPTVEPETEVKLTLQQLKDECKTRGGYLQIHASCGGVNMCKGFSFVGDGEGSFSDHTCRMANGCAGASCTVLPPERAVPRTGKEIYEDQSNPSFGPATCLQCHAAWVTNAAGHYEISDMNQFTLFVPVGSTRNANNWLQISNAEQEGIVAFGKITAMPDGTPLIGMTGYHQMLSRGEIERVVAHIRTLRPVLKEMAGPK